MAIDNDSKQQILNEISAIRALLTRLQPVSGGTMSDGAKLIDTRQDDKRVLILF
jgi:hypothetical protein